MNILAIDDDGAVRQLLDAYLSAEGYRVTTAATTAEAGACLERETFHLVIVDLRLPDGDGLSLVQRIRGESGIPVIILSSKDQAIDRIVGIELGADDYLTKPFEPRELLARMKAVLRRASGESVAARGEDLRAVVRFDEWELDLTAQRLRHQDGRDVDLTRGEYGLLAAFVKRPQRVLSRDQLLDYTRLDGAEVFDRSIDVLILRLRRKIEANPKEPRLIKTERGAGYLFDAKVRPA